jgi:hypothetical protein
MINSGLIMKRGFRVAGCSFIGDFGGINCENKPYILAIRTEF